LTKIGLKIFVEIRREMSERRQFDKGCDKGAKGRSAGKGD